MSFAQLFWWRGKQLPGKSISLILKTALASVRGSGEELLQSSDPGVGYSSFNMRLSWLLKTIDSAVGAGVLLSL